MSEFHRTDLRERPFAFGEFYGIRSFKVNRNRLSAVSAAYIYRPGENVADCAIAGPFGKMLRSLVVKGDKITVEWDKHGAAGSPWCVCGFYAYYTRMRNYYSSPSTVTGIVSAYGRVSYSNYGFRAQMCQIVAAVNPYLNEMEAPWYWRMVFKMLSINVWSAWMAVTILNLINVLLGMGFDYIGVPYNSLWGTIVLMSFYFGRLLGGVIFTKWWRRQGSKTESSGKEIRYRTFEDGQVSSNLSASTFVALAKRYPEIQWYSTVEEMLSEWPLTKYQDLPKLP